MSGKALAAGSFSLLPPHIRGKIRLKFKRLQSPKTSLSASKLRRSPPARKSAELSPSGHRILGGVNRADPARHPHGTGCKSRPCRDATHPRPVAQHSRQNRAAAPTGRHQVGRSANIHRERGHVVRWQLPEQGIHSDREWHNLVCIMSDGRVQFDCLDVSCLSLLRFPDRVRVRALLQTKGYPGPL